MTLDGLRREPAIYLLPEWESKEQALEHCEKQRRDFRGTLNGWYRVPSMRPAQRGLNAFLRWFECSVHSMIIDLCDEPMEHEYI